MFARLLSRRRSRKSSRRKSYLPYAEQLEGRLLLVGEVLEFDTSLTSLDLTGGPYPMPLASDPGNLLGDSVMGYGFVNSEVRITLSSERAVPGPPSLGTACAFPGGIGTANVQHGCFDEYGGGEPDPIDPNELDGQPFFVESFFDVFFDITVTDVDPRPGRDFAGQGPGASIQLLDNGPANMVSIYDVIFDKDAPNFGIIPPPQVAPYIGHFNVEIPLGGDINGNGVDDKIKFTVASHAAGDENRTFTTLPDGTVIDGFDSAAFLEGAVVDETTDPPFTLGAGDEFAPAFDGPGALTGPTTATSTLLNPIIEVDVFPRTIGQLVIESPPPAGAITPNPELPPEDGEYRTAADVHAEFQGPALTVVLQDIRHRAVAGTTVRTPVGPDEFEEFVSTLQGTAIIDGQAFPVELNGPVQVISFDKVGNTTGTFDTEMISMTLTGQIPGGPTIVIQESPSQPSLGRTTITDLGTGNFQIDSFFDVFTELSIDGDPFIASTEAARVNLVQPGIRTPNPELPPTDGVYRTAADVHAEFQGPDLEIVLQDIRHRPFAERIVRTPIGPDELEQFNSSLTGTAVVTSAGLGLDGVLIPVELTGPVETIVFGKVGNTTGTFQTEIISMSLSGDLPLPGGGTLPIVIQESPTLATLGEVRIQDIGGGQFHIDSFFDVFTEISVDGGPFIPSTGPAHVELAPAPILVTGAGPATVNVFFEGPVEGDANDDDFNGLDEVVTELVQADFDGYHPQLGPIQIRLRDDQPSLGQIEELVNNTPGLLDVNPFAPGQADSFFDVFFDITVVATGQVLTTAQPTRVQTVINNKPPEDGERYIFNPPQPVELLDKATGQPTGFYITKEIHDESPTVEHDIFPRTVGQILIQLPDGSTELLTTAGPSQVDVYFEGPAEGDATDDDGDGFDEVVSELVQADFDGFHPLLGPVQIRLRDDFPSLGQITELVNNTPGLLDVDPFAPGAADSFFDVFFEITLPATGQTLVTAAPTRVQSVIENKPPEDGERYIFNPPQPVELIDSVTGLGTGIFIVREIHDENPTVEHDIFPNSVGQIRLQLPDGSTDLLNTAGPSQVDVYFEGPAEGDATDDNGDGLDEVVSELVQADLDGVHPLLGPVQIRLRTDVPSLGQITEQVNNTPGLLDVDPFAPGAADSFFDVFFEITLLQTGQRLTTQAPTRLQTVIENKPPDAGEQYEFNPPSPVELFDAVTGLPTGIFIVQEIHIPCGLLVTNTNDSGPGSLREAIVCANTNVGLDTISFDIAGPGPHTITPLSPLPSITDAVVIDGTTEPDFTGTPVVELDGSSAGPSAKGLTVLAGPSTILGLVINRWNDVGIFLGSGSDGSFVDLNYIGTDVAGTAGLPNGTGIRINRSSNNTIGTGAAGNVISGNTGAGIRISSAASTGNNIWHNLIGTDFTGTVALGNDVGVEVASAQSNNIGGSSGSQGNTISGNVDVGVKLRGDNNDVQGNRIGTDISGTASVPNNNGIEIAVSTGNTVGGTAANASNQISGNANAGLLISGATATANFVEGNLIGADATGSGSLGNKEGVLIDGAPANTIGGTDVGAGNTIAGNTKNGIYIRNAGATGNVVQNNLIGANPLAMAIVPNGRGVLIDNAPTNQIGTAGAGNLISGNVGEGIRIQNAGSTGNTVQGNTIGLNASETAAVPNNIGVRIRNLATGNTIGGDSTAGQGNLIAGNTLDGVSVKNADGNQTHGNTIGTNAAGAAGLGNGSDGVEIANSQNTQVGGSGSGQGNVISGNTAFGVRLLASSSSNTVRGNRIGTDPSGLAPLPNQTGVYVFGSANTIGGSNPGEGNVISGNADAGVRLDGASATGNMLFGNLVGVNATGTGAVANKYGAYITGAASNIVGGANNGEGNTISGNTLHGVYLFGAGTTGNSVEGNQIGTNPAGTAPVANQGQGVLIDNAAGNTIGSPAPGAGNLISGNTLDGVKISGLAATGNALEGNTIGEDLGGNPIPNRNGVLIADGASGNTVGDGTAAGSNTIADNSQRGIWINGNAGTGNAVSRNSIHNNGGAARLGIDLGGSGVTANDPGDPDAGANNLQNSPMIGAVLNAGNLDVIYSVDSTTANSAYPLTVEFFVADSDFQEGETFLGDVQYTAAVAGGSAAGSIPAGPAGIGTIIVATATDADGNTSEFSAPVTVAAMLSAAGGEASPESRVEGQGLALDELLPVVDAAISRFASLGFDGDLFATVDVSIADLPGAALGAATTNSVTIDVDAAGHGWFIDPTPLDDSEFSNPHSAIQDPKSIDLLTAVMHELGHAIGFEDLHSAGAEDDLMFGLLGPGVRKTALEASLADEVFADGE